MLATQARIHMRTMMIHRYRRLVSLWALALLLSVIPAPGHAQSSGQAVVKDLEEPRFHSLKSDRVNVRRGPGLQYPVSWIFRQVGMPVEVIREFENWWQIRDSEGAEGWIYKGLLARRRTALLAPWATNESEPASIAMRTDAEAASTVVAFAEPGTIADIGECNGQWCRVVIEPYEGWIEQKQLWGVYKREAIRP